MRCENMSFHNFIADWDENAKKFCRIRNDVAHVFEYLENLGEDDRKRKLDEYIQLNDEIAKDVKALEVVVEDGIKLGRLQTHKVPTEYQKRDRLSSILGKFFVSPMCTV